MNKIFKSKEITISNKLKNKKHLSRKKIYIIVSAVLLFILAVVLAVAYLLPKTPSIKQGNITIGDITITPNDIDNYVKSIQDFKSQNPDVILDGDERTIAINDLIMNAALKQNAKINNVTVSNKEILAEAYIFISSDQEADSSIDYMLGDKNSMSRVRNENVAYQSKLNDYILARKGLFIVSITFDSPYFRNLTPRDSIQSEYDSAKNKLQNDILPLFDKKSTKEDIAKYTDINNLDDDFSDAEKYIGEYNGFYSVSNYYSGFQENSNFFNNISDTTSYVFGDVGKIYKIDDKIAELKNIGDYTDVFASQTGEFAIIRLESQTKGKYNSWEDFLEYYKRQYAYSYPSVVLSDLSYGTQLILEKTINSISSIGVEKAYAFPSYCSGHELRYNVKSYDVTNQVQIGGTTMRFKSNGSSTCYGSVDSTVTTIASGYVTQGYNCYGVGMWYNGTSGNPTPLIHPAGYTYQGVRSPYEYPNSDSANHWGWPEWTPSTMNGLGKGVYITFLYTKPVANWQITPTIAVDPNTVKPGDTITWTHYVESSAPTTKVVTYYDKGYGSPANSATMAIGQVKGTNLISTYKAKSSDGGKTICRHTEAAPKNNSNNGTVTSSDACVFVRNPTWTVTPKSEVSVDGGASWHTGTIDADFGDTVTWRTSITNNTGSDPTDNGLTYHYNNDANLKGRTGHNNVTGSDYDGTGLSAGSTASKTTNLYGSDAFTISAAQDAGKTYCRSTTASQGTRGGSSVTSANACVYIPYDWNIIGTTKVRVVKQDGGADLYDLYPETSPAIVKVGDLVTWEHQVSVNNAVNKTKTNTAVNYGYKNGTGFATITGVLGSLASGSNPSTSSPIEITRFNNSSPYKVTSNDVGVFCRATYANPSSGEPISYTDFVSNYSCVELKYDYDLTPSISGSNGTTDPGSTITSTPSVANSGPTKSRPTTWKLTRMLFAPGVDSANNTSARNDSSPCSYYSNGSAYECDEDFKSGSNTVFATTGEVLSGTNLSSGSYIVPEDLAAGTKICFALSVSWPTEADIPLWGHSTLICQTIVKKPKAQVIGGDLWTNGNVIANKSIYLDLDISSWAEYGILAKGTIKDMASGTVLTGFNSAILSHPSTCQFSVLSFNNFNGGHDCSGTIGLYDTTRTVPDITLESIMRADTTVSPLSGADIDISTSEGSGSVGYNASSDINITGGTIAAGSSIIISAPNNTITIKGDINYSNGPFSDIKNIPQVVIIAKNIDIYDSVTNIDAWLVQKGDGYINTCSYLTATGTTLTVEGELDVTKCNNQLKINGPIITNKLYLRRTYGSDYSTRTEAAEIMKARSDSYLWAYANASSNVNMQTVYEIELPARF